MKTNILRLLSSGLLLLSSSALLRADHESDRRNERIPVGHQMHHPLHQAVRPFASSGPTGYTPQQLRHAYGFDQLGATGAGQIIAIVDAYGSPTIQADLNTFCAAFGIPSTTVLVYNPQGQPAVNSGWGSETSLDVEWAHAIAPGATIAVIDAKSASTADLLAAVDFAVGLGAKQVSMSWGGSEFSTESSSDYHFNVSGVAFFASAGDSGAGAEYPAASPFVVAVGGTTLHLSSSNTISSETAWSGSGGGASAYESLPGFQSGWYSGSKRGIPDVAYDADPATGVPVYQTGAGWQQFGGTSMSAPQWAALFALANSLRASSVSSAPGTLYSLANSNYAGYYRDITSGSNGHSAGPRYDLVTGLGSPLGDPLVLALAGGSSQPAAAPAFSPPAGTYTSAQNVTISSATAGVSIRYTIDGSTPSETHGTLYSAPVNISATTTLKAIAYESGFLDSAITTATYTIGSASSVTINDTDSGIAYTGAWSHSTGRGLGDYQDDVHYTKTNGDSMSYTFTGTGIAYITEKNTDEGNVDVYIDGVLQQTVNCANATRLVQQTVYNATGLASGSHTLRLVKSSGSFMLVDALTISNSTQPQVAAPAFSPAGGTYSSAQNVTISDSTPGATIRYTIDGSTPSETNGTIYSGPVNIITTTTLRAIAYESGMTDSTVTSATYTISVGGGTTVSFEAESLTYTPSGATASVQTDANSSGGHWVVLSGNSVGDFITYSIPTVTAGTYQLQMEWKGLGSRGILQLSVDGTNLGPTLDQYSASATYPTTTFGTVTFSSTGTHIVRLTVTGKNSKSSSYQLSADKFTFVGQ